jgi:glycine oxidase
MTDKYDYIIVGGGITGCILTERLLSEGQRVLIFDNDFESSPSAISSGIINPVTGRNLVKSWMVDELLVVADEYYPYLEKILREQFYHHTPIYRTIKGVKELNDFSTRVIDEDSKNYLDEKDIQISKENYTSFEKVFEIKHSRRLDIPRLCALFVEDFISKKIIINETFDINELEIREENISYKNYSASNIIFCEGSRIRHNPLFNFIPFIIAKGEILEVEIPNLDQEFILNNHKILMPMGGDKYWFGATFNWNLDDDTLTEKGKSDLVNNINELVQLTKNITAHKGAERPTIKDRRPVMGFHPDYKNVFVFNGMGTKAASLLPYYSKHFVECIVEGKEVMEEVSVRRFVL